MSTARTFESTVLPLLDSAFNLARWLLRDDTHAQDAVQEAVLKALRHYASLRGDDARAWFLAIVRNVCYTHLKERAQWKEVAGLEDEALEAFELAAGQVAPSPAHALEQSRCRAQINAALHALPAALREVVVLRELEGLEYEQIANIAHIPLGTVMSRLSRARARMKELLGAYRAHG